MNTWKQFSLDDRAKIREEYKKVWHKLTQGERLDPYAIWPHNWYLYMSPIERNVWQDIRFYGQSFYPQAPIGNFFVDFANVASRIIIEADGKEYHQDKAKDEARDHQLKLLGWTVYRVDGRDTFPELDVLQEEWNHQELSEDEQEMRFEEFLNAGSSQALIMRLRGVV